MRYLLLVGSFFLNPFLPIQPKLKKLSTITPFLELASRASQHLVYDVGATWHFQTHKTLPINRTPLVTEIRKKIVKRSQNFEKEKPWTPAKIPRAPKNCKHNTQKPVNFGSLAFKLHLFSNISWLKKTIHTSFWPTR